MRPFPGGLLPTQVVGSYTKPPWLTRWIKGSVGPRREDPDVWGELAGIGPGEGGPP